jgi:hypothetical protein
MLFSCRPSFGTCPLHSAVSSLRDVSILSSKCSTEHCLRRPIFYNVTPCSLIHGDWFFREIAASLITDLGESCRDPISGAIPPYAYRDLGESTKSVCLFRFERQISRKMSEVLSGKVVVSDTGPNPDPEGSDPHPSVSAPKVPSIRTNTHEICHFSHCV